MTVRRPAFDPKPTASLLACLLGSMLVLAGTSSPPHVTISSLNAIEEGTTVYVSGLLVSLWRYDTGTESLLLADPSDGSTVKVICAQGIAAFPGTYLCIGDEVLAKGEVMESGRQRVLVSGTDEIERLRPSESALTVKTVCLHWLLFEDDRFNVTGTISTDGGLRLQDLESEYSISLRLAVGATVPSPDGGVCADCTLCLDESQMLIYLLVWSLSPQ
jgi:hypothetical protein